MKCHLDETLGPDTKLYRYMSLESFMSLVETKALTLTKVNTWDDPWEAVLAKAPTAHNNGELTRPQYHERYYGQCWTLAEDSDAMWRIYSPSRTGIQISTSAQKFSLIQGIKHGYLGKVTYFESEADLRKKANTSGANIWNEALFKRKAFAHEMEVRVLTLEDFLEDDHPQSKHVSLSVDPVAFVESVTLDPRADNWYVDVIASYCSRIGLDTKPLKSSLYAPDPTLDIVRKYVPRGSK